LTQSLAIIEYLDETHPAPPLLPRDAFTRAQVRALAQAMASDIHPLQTLRVRNRLTETFKLSGDEASEWSRRWIEDGLVSVEKMVAPTPSRGQFCFGDAVTLADVVLVPQIYNARRFQCELRRIPHLAAIDERLRALPAFAAAAPENQPGNQIMPE